MRASELLRQLDRRLLPPLARGLTELGQGPTRTLVLAGAAVLSCAAVLVTAVWATGGPTGGAPLLGGVTRVGVVQGQSVPGYVESSRGELAALVTGPTGPDSETYALVTLAAYLAPDRLAPALGGVSVSEVFARVPLPDAQTRIVRIPALRMPDDVVAGMAQVAADKDRVSRDYRSRAAAVTGTGQEERELRAIYDTGARVAAAEATAYRSHCSCLYAAVVRATPVDLQRVASRPGVRAVDPAPEVTRLDRAVFTPPLPEQTDVVATLPDGGLSTSEPVVPAPASTADPAAAPTPGSVPGSPTVPPSDRSAEPASPAAPAPGTPTPAEPPTPAPEPATSSHSLPTPTATP